jgi:urea transport system substrate-binding protein
MLCHSYAGKAAADGIGYEIARDFGVIAPVTLYCKVSL